MVRWEGGKVHSPIAPEVYPSRQSGNPGAIGAGPERDRARRDDAERSMIRVLPKLCAITSLDAIREPCEASMVGGDCPRRELEKPHMSNATDLARAPRVLPDLAQASKEQLLALIAEMKAREAAPQRLTIKLNHVRVGVKRHRG